MYRSYDDKEGWPRQGGTRSMVLRVRELRRRRATTTSEAWDTTCLQPWWVFFSSRFYIFYSLTIYRSNMSSTRPPPPLPHWHSTHTATTTSLAKHPMTRREGLEMCGKFFFPLAFIYFNNKYLQTRIGRVLDMSASTYCHLTTTYQPLWLTLRTWQLVVASGEIEGEVFSPGGASY